MKFWKKKTDITEEPQMQVIPNFVVKLKQDRNMNWIVGELRVQADTKDELKVLLDECVEVADTKCYLLNNGGS